GVNCLPLRSVKHTFILALFPPPLKKQQMINGQRSLWRELGVAYSALIALLRMSFHADSCFSSPERLRSSCASSKRKRPLTLLAFAAYSA
ncbi:MAG: hypothetical protein IKM84_00315, partial [Oscillospiraceae bacterium]|nr:hypothetical protein [Oscillospiraceae bacterium]